ncbi:MAG: SagB/ThcOx family dehydrogenase [Candidatus Omnitrophica bacterium]|nr:SagB/ThcOx family dehydrogenase [Candidatus Omnitrophota bacterium]
MRLIVYRFFVISVFLLCVGCFSPRPVSAAETLIKLPQPEYKGKLSVEEALYLRCSVRSYSVDPLSLKEAGQILWAACGVNFDGVSGATRTAPSAGATYSIELYLVAGNVEGLEPGVYRYLRDQHALEVLRKGDVRGQLSEASRGQKCVMEAPAVIVLISTTSRTTNRYGERGMQYIFIDAGHIGENIHLEAESLGLGTVAVGAFSEERVAEILGVTGTPVYLMPIGKKR